MKAWLPAALLLFLLSSFAAAADIEILCRKSYFTPDRITVKKGEKVRLTLKSADVSHGFAIDELDIAVEVAPGPPRVIEFTPARAGRYEFYCVVRCGKDHLKMRGVLIVED
jgi:heme/copper-type cytochrome/quinol oxidase subunit 2